MCACMCELGHKALAPERGEGFRYYTHTLKAMQVVYRMANLMFFPEKAEVRNTKSMQTLTDMQPSVLAVNRVPLTVKKYNGAVKRWKE